MSVKTVSKAISTFMTVITSLIWKLLMIFLIMHLYKIIYDPFVQQMTPLCVGTGRIPLSDGRQSCKLSFKFFAKKC